MGILFRFIAPINNTKCFIAHCECDDCERDDGDDDKKVGSIEKIK